MYLTANALSLIFLAGKSSAPLLGGGWGARREARRKSERVDLNMCVGPLEVGDTIEFGMDNSHPTSSGANVVRYNGVRYKVTSQVGFCGSGTRTDAKSKRKRDKELDEVGEGGVVVDAAAPEVRTALSPSIDAKLAGKDAAERARILGGALKKARKEAKAAQWGPCALGATMRPSRRRVAPTRRSRAQPGVAARPSRRATTRPA